MNPCVRFSLLISLLVLLLTAAHAVPTFDDGLPRNNSTPFLIKEGLDRTYSDELVTYAVTFPANTNPNSLRLYDEDNAVFLTFQLANAVYNGGAISSASVSFWVNTLSAGGQRHYTLYHDPGTGFSPPTFPALGVTHTDLTQSTVDISNGTIDLRLWGGSQTYAPPADPTTLPGIIRGVKGVDGVWRGSGAMVASANVASHTLSIYEEGPLWRTYQEYLTFPNGQNYQMLFTVFPNREYVLVHEYGSNTFTWPSATTRANMQVFRLNDFAPDRFLTYGTFAKTITSTALNTANTQYYLAGLPSGPVWGNGGWGGLYATDAAKNDVIGVVPVRTGTWNGAGSWVTFNTDPTNLQELRLSMAISERHWLLVVTNKAQAVLSSAQVEATTTPSHIIWWGSTTGWEDRITPDSCNLWKLRVKWCDFPLNKVKDWVLDYDVGAVSHPHVFFDSSAIATAKTRLDTDPSYAFQKTYLMDTQALEYIEYGTVADLFRTNTAIRDDWDLGDATAFVKEQMDLGYASSCYVLSTGQALQMSVLYADLLWNALPLAEKQRWSRYALALGYILRDNDNWRGVYSQGTLAPFGNFNSCRWSGLGLAGVMFQGHTDAAEWRTFAQNEMDQETSTTISADGVYLENISNYMPFWWQNVGLVSMALQRKGYANYSTTPRYQKAVEFLVSTLTPPDATFNQDAVTHVGKRMIPPVGHHPGAGYRNYGQFAWSSNLLGQSTDPGGWAQWAWNQNGKHAGHHFRLPINLFVADPSSRQVTYPLKSKAWDDYGFVFRNHVGTSRESYFLLKNSRVEWHHEADEGSFHFFGKGVLLAGDGLNLLSTDPACTTCDTQKTDATDRVSQRSALHHNLITFQGPTSDGMIRGMWQSFKSFGAPVNNKADSASQNFDVTFSDDLQYVLTGSLDRCIRIWNPHTAKTIRTVGPGQDYMFATAISPNGQYVAGGNRYQIVMWNATTGAQLYSWATSIYWGGTNGTGQNALAFSPDSSRLAVACGDGHVRLYNTGNGTLQADYNVQLGNLYTVAYAPNGLRLAIGSTTQVAIWDLTTGNPLIYLSQTPGWQDSGFAVSYSPDGTKVVVGGIPNIPQYTDAKVTVWDATVPGGQPTPFTRSTWIWRVSSAHGNFVNGARFSPNGAYVATGGNDARAYVFDAANGTQLRYIPVITDGYPYQVKDVAWSPDSLEVYLTQPMSNGVFRFASYYRTTITTPTGWMGVDYGHANIPKTSTAATPMAMDNSYNRRALLVKSKTADGPEYAVLQDTTYGPDLPEWNLDVHSPSPTVNPNGRSGWVTFPGFSEAGFGVAMDAVFVSPGNPDIWTEQGHVDSGYQGVWNVRGHSLLHATPSAALGQVDYWVQYAHTSIPYSAAISPDRKYLISGGSTIYDSNWNVIGTEYVVKLWDRKTGKLVRVFGPGTDIIFSCKISPNTQYIAAGNRYQVLVWNVSNGTQRFSLPTALRYGTRGVPPNSLAFSADSGKLAVLCSDGRLRIYNMSDGSEYRNIALPFEAYAVAFSPNGTRIAVGGDGHVATWDLASSTLQIDCTTGLTWEDSVWSVEFSPDSTQLATGGVPNGSWTDCKLTLWDATVPQTIPYTRTGYQYRVGGFNGNYMQAVRYSPDGAYLLSVNQDSFNFIWEADTLTQVRPVPPQSCPTKDGAWNSDGREAWVISLSATTPYAGGQLHLASVARDVNGNTVGWPGGVDHWIENPQDAVYGCAFAKDLSTTATGGGTATKNVKLWNRHTGRLIWASAAGTDIMFSVAISPNNQFVACGNRQQVWLLNGSTGAQVYALPTTLRWGSIGVPLNSLTFSPDSSKVAVLCGDGHLRLYNTGTGAEVANITISYEAYCVAFSADGSRIAVGGAGHVATWEVATGTQQIDCTTGLTWEDSVYSVSFSPDGTRLLTGGKPNSTWNDAKITLWDATVPGGPLPVTRNTYLWRLNNKHGNYINAVRFTPDGRFFASAANDNLAYIFDAATGAQIRALPGQSAYIKDAMWSADGSELWLETPVSSVMGTALRMSSFGGAEVSMPFLTVLYPRLSTQSQPTITSIANGKGAQIQHSWGTDTVLMSDTPFTYNEGGISFTGRVAVIRNMTNETWMNLIDGTSLSWNGRTLTAPGLTRWQLP